MPRLSKLIVIPAALLVGACLAALPGMGQGKLKASIHRSANASPLDPTLAPGNIFDKKTVAALIAKKQAPSNWHMIPKWRTGQWRADQLINTFSRSEKSGRVNKPFRAKAERVTTTEGEYTDKAGRVWSSGTQGRWEENDKGSHTLYIYELSRRVLTNTEKEYSFELEDLNFLVNKRTKLIHDCYRTTMYITMVPLSPNAIRHKTLQRNFDWKGIPTTTLENVDNLKRIASVRPDYDKLTPEGKPLYPLFVEYLKEHDMDDRIPDAPLTAPGVVAKP